VGPAGRICCFAQEMSPRERAANEWLRGVTRRRGPLGFCMTWQLTWVMLSTLFSTKVRKLVTVPVFFSFFLFFFQLFFSLTVTSALPVFPT
jgi:hypothetical protein